MKIESSISADNRVSIRKLVVILGVPIDALNMAETLDRLEKLVLIGRKTSQNFQVTTINTDFIVKSLFDPELRYLLQDADLALPDGMPLVWSARLLGIPLTERVAGADLIPQLAGMAAEKGFSIYLLGAGPGIAQTAADILTETFPNLKIAGVSSPPYQSVLEMDPSLVKKINAAQPDILLVAFGNPKQEKWIGMYREQLQVPVMIGVGGSLDFVAGQKKRAPDWMRNIGLEWLHRLFHEPGRLWRRYAVDMIGYGTFFVWQLWYMYRGKGPEPVLPTSELIELDDEVYVNLDGRLTVENADWLFTTGEQALDISPNVIAKMDKVTFIDSSAIGMLIELTRLARDQEGEFWLTGLQPNVKQTFALMRLDSFFAIQPETSDHVKTNGVRPENGKKNRLLHTANESKWSILTVPRNLDARTSPSILEEATDILWESPFLIIDFSQTKVLSSAGLAILAKLEKESSKLNGQLRVAGCNQDVLRVIQMARFDKLLSLFDSVPAAMSSS